MLNTYGELGLELVTAICAFILPRLILSYFGSKYNGITTSISQFIGCVALMKSGIGSVTRASLYQPLAEHDYDRISAVVRATEFFMRKVAMAFLGGILIFAAVYPLVVSKDFDWCFAFSLVLILSISTFGQYYFGLTYQMVIQADQKNYIIALTQIAATVLNTAVSSALIIAGCSIHIVKLGSALVFLLPPLFYSAYAKKHYRIHKHVKADTALISQRWDAFAHQLANFINSNTDVLVITVFLGVGEVSVYTIYYMVCNAVRKIINAFSSGMTAAFGNMIAKNETEVLKKRFSQFELFIYIAATILFTTTALLLVPFVMIYTAGITDADYNRKWFGFLICAAEFFACTKIPYETLTYAAGKFKQTRGGVFIEAGLNIIISVAAVNIIGMEGVVIGTIAAAAFRTFRYNRFISVSIIKRPKLSIVKYMLFSAVSAAVCICFGNYIPITMATDFLTWGGLACITFAMAATVVCAISLVLFHSAFIGLLKTMMTSFCPKSNKKTKG